MANLVYNVVSMLLIKKIELHLELRVKTVCKMVVKRLPYDLSKFNNGSSLSSKGFEEDVLRTLTIGNYNGLRHIPVLYNILNCTVNLMYPNIKKTAFLNRDLFHSHLDRKKMPMNVQHWTLCSQILQIKILKTGAQTTLFYV